MIQIALKAVRMTAGVILILIGVIAGFIPILQGWIFILAGMALLGIKPEHVKKYWHSLKEKWSRRKYTRIESDPD